MPSKSERLDELEASEKEVKRILTGPDGATQVTATYQGVLFDLIEHHSRLKAVEHDVPELIRELEVLVNRVRTLEGLSNTEEERVGKLTDRVAALEDRKQISKEHSVAVGIEAAVAVAREEHPCFDANQLIVRMLEVGIGAALECQPQRTLHNPSTAIQQRHWHPVSQSLLDRISQIISGPACPLERFRSEEQEGE